MARTKLHRLTISIARRLFPSCKQTARTYAYPAIVMRTCSSTRASNPLFQFDSTSAFACRFFYTQASFFFFLFLLKYAARYKEAESDFDLSPGQGKLKQPKSRHPFREASTQSLTIAYSQQVFLSLSAVNLINRLILPHQYTVASNVSENR